MSTKNKHAVNKTIDNLIMFINTEKPSPLSMIKYINTDNIILKQAYADLVRLCMDGNKIKKCMESASNYKLKKSCAIMYITNHNKQVNLLEVCIKLEKLEE